MYISNRVIIVSLEIYQEREREREKERGTWTIDFIPILARLMRANNRRGERIPFADLSQQLQLVRSCESWESVCEFPKSKRDTDQLLTPRVFLLLAWPCSNTRNEG